CCLLENLTLHPQRLILPTQPRQLLTLITREAVRALALITLGLLDPIAQRHIRDPKILRDLMLRLARDPDELDRLTLELLRIRRSGSRHFSPPEPGLSTKALRCPRNRGHSTEPSTVLPVRGSRSVARGRR